MHIYFFNKLYFPMQVQNHKITHIYIYMVYIYIICLKYNPQLQDTARLLYFKTEQYYPHTQIFELIV